MSDNRYPMGVFLFFAIFAIVVSSPWRVSPQAQRSPQPPTAAQQKPVFRGGTHFVRVDAYPAADGHIVEGLKPEDFEVTEDGKRQTVESLDFIRFDALTAEAERRDPVSQQAGFDMAADPRYRLFVVYVDLTFTKSANGIENMPLIEQPLVNFLERVIGTQDLFGLLTTRNSVKDLVLAQKTTVTVSEVKDLLRAKYIERDEADEVLDACPWDPPVIQLLKYLYRADATYTNLKELAVQLGSLRQERKNLVLVTNLLPRWRPNRSLYESLVSAQRGNAGQPGIVNGRITNDNRDVYTNGRGGNLNGCMAEAGRLSLMDFEPRYHELLDEAKRQNVSIYVITPSGLQAPFTYAGVLSMRAASEDLRALAGETDGLAVIDTNDPNAAFKKIGEDLAAYYVLGYYTTNTNFDGGLRKITVKVQGKAVRARRQYRAPTEAEIASLANRSAAPAAAPVESGPPTLVGDPVAFRVALRQPPERSPRLEFTRTDRLRVEWPVLAALDRREARLLDSSGKALPIDVPLSETEGGKSLVAELPLAPFGKGVYSIELTAGAGGKTERRRLTFTMK